MNRAQETVTLEGHRLEFVAALRDRQNADGGFGACAGYPSDTEATALALLALHSASDGAAVQSAGQWLGRQQSSDGSWPRADVAPSGGWSTSLAALALGRSGLDEAAARRGLGWLLDVEGGRLPLRTRLVQRLFPELKSAEMDYSLTGWPWTEGAFSWVEPTSNALITLKALTHLAPARKAAERIQRGERMLLDRVCVHGGWNYGNRIVLGEELEPFPDTTALALIALHDTPRSEPVQRSLSALESMLHTHDSGLTLALAVLCFRLYQRPVLPYVDRLQRRFEESGFLGETRPLALSVMALAEDHAMRFVPHA